MSTTIEKPTMIFKIESTPIHNVLLSIGVPPNLLGYSYILYALQLILLQPEYMQAITKELYADIARKYCTSSTRVERNIRTAIQTTWLYGNVEMINRLFQNSVRPDKGYPTNSMFLARLYYYISNTEAR